MLTSTDVLNTARAALHSALYSPACKVPGAVFSIEVCEQEQPQGRWSATIEVSGQVSSMPLNFSLHLEPLLRSQLGRCFLRSCFEMTVSFHHQERHYGYGFGRWSENGKPISSVICEQIHPLAMVSATAVDATVAVVNFLGFLDAMSTGVWQKPVDVCHRSFTQSVDDGH